MNNHEQDRETSQRKSLGFNRKSVRHLMNQLSITPPARVWNNIEKILDQQDTAKLEQQKTNVAAAKRKKKNYMDYAAAVMVLAVLLKLVK